MLDSNKLTHEEILVEIKRLQTENLLNDKKIQYLMGILLSNTENSINSLSYEKTLSYKLGNLLINTPKNYEGGKKILKGLLELKSDALIRKHKKGRSLTALDKTLLNIFKANDDYKKLINTDGNILEKDVLIGIPSLQQSFNKVILNKIEIINNVSNVFTIGEMPEGVYEFSIRYKESLLSVNRKCLYIGFGNSQIDNISKATSLSVSEKAGPYFYIGGGIFDSEKNSYKQTFRLKISNKLENIEFSVFSSLSKVILDELVIELYEEKKKPNLIPEKNIVKTFDECLGDNFLKKLDVDFILYADINVNVVDGSSVWFSSMATVLSSIGKLAIILKESPRHNQIISNIKGTYEPIYIDPKTLGYDGIFNVQDSVRIIKNIDNYSTNLKLVVVRGIDVAYELHADNQFLGRTASYVTDFYSIDDNGLIINEKKLEKLQLIADKTEYLITQTNEIRNKILELTKSKANLISFVPTLPKDSQQFFSEKFKVDNKKITIGYAGKITPSWGVLELFDWVEQFQKENDITIELHIASNKISSPIDAKKFRHHIHSKIKHLNAHYYNNLNREECMHLLSKMDYVWCWRPSSLEDNTLELSTKLMEAAVIGARTINYPSKINKNFLGIDYPFYIRNYESFKTLLMNPINFNGLELSNSVIEKHAIYNHILEFSNKFNIKVVKSKNILFASHDFKFIDPFISDLKKQGYSIKKQMWEWGGHKNEAELKDNYNWADIIFCEWGLANATWYSKNNIDKKPLYIRMHAQEIRDRARKFGNQIVWDNVKQVIFVSNEIREQALVLWPNMPKEKISKIPNFILEDKLTFNMEKFNDLSEIRLGILGIVPQTKRLDRAVDILKKLRADGKNVKLYVKGYRPEELEFMHAPSRKSELDYYYDIYSEIEKNNLTDHVVFEGWGNNVNEWYSKIHFILSPSDNESFHYALADGIVAGCYPIVWNWKSYNEHYPFLKAVENTDDVVDVINNVVSNENDFIMNKISYYRNNIILNNGKVAVYKKLNNIINI